MTDIADQRRPVVNDFILDKDGNPRGGLSQGEGFIIDWQNGVQKRNGAFLEEILETCKARLEFFQNSKFNCLENDEAITGITMALQAMERRLNDRKARGVEGSYNE